MKILYFDCFSGISGDMTVGALINLFVPFDYLAAELAKISISEEFTVSVHNVSKLGIGGVKFNVNLKSDSHKHEDTHSHSHHRTLQDINFIIDNSDLNDNVKTLSKKIFYNLAEAEAKVHGSDINKVHFHEAGAVDSIVDIIGAAVCIDYISPDKIVSSVLCEGQGFVNCAHGRLPVPVPAVAELLATNNVPIKITETQTELITPTGAAIITTIADEFGSTPDIYMEKIGWGAGEKDLNHPNFLRVFMGTSKNSDLSTKIQKNSLQNIDFVIIIESNIDDMTPEQCGFALECLLEAGALDAYCIPAYMKKNRPGFVLTVITTAENTTAMENIIFAQTSTIGLRKYSAQRSILPREIITVKTVYGEGRVKVCRFKNSVNDSGKVSEIVKAYPEYEDVKKAALEFNVPYDHVYHAFKDTAQGLLDD